MPRRVRPASSSSCRNEPHQPSPRAKTSFVDVKLSGCRTHMEHIVSVHDLFRGSVRLLRIQRHLSTWGLVEMLTRKQYELLRFINERLKEAGVPPSFDEMKDALDLRSKSGIHRLITALEERGFIRRLPNRARAIEVIKLPELSGSSGGNGRRGFTPSVIEGNLGRVRPSGGSGAEDDGNRPVAVPVMGR